VLSIVASEEISPSYTIQHRGSSNYFLHNSIQGVSNTLSEPDTSGIEVDLHYSNFEWKLCHDQYFGVCVGPTIEEFFEQAANSHKVLILEIKNTAPIKGYELLDRLIREYDLHSSVVIASFNEDNQLEFFVDKGYIIAQFIERTRFSYDPTLITASWDDRFDEYSEDEPISMRLFIRLRGIPISTTTLEYVEQIAYDYSQDGNTLRIWYTGIHPSNREDITKIKEKIWGRYQPIVSIED